MVRCIIFQVPNVSTIKQIVITSSDSPHKLTRNNYSSHVIITVAVFHAKQLNLHSINKVYLCAIFVYLSTKGLLYFCIDVSSVLLFILPVVVAVHNARCTVCCVYSHS
jgi:hypothetical protein